MTALLMFGLCAGGLWWAFSKLPTVEQMREREAEAKRRKLPWHVRMEGELEVMRKKALRGGRLTQREKELLIRELILRKGNDVDL